MGNINYEYQIIKKEYVKVGNFEEESFLNKEGDNGWELTNIIKEKNPHYDKDSFRKDNSEFFTFYYFKRIFNND